MLNIGGRKSRNKVAVGEPAAGSLIVKSVLNFLILISSNHAMGDVSESDAMKSVIGNEIPAEI